ncbi:MAG TPA: nuclear transport factor 2 family protein [Gemmatimonadaceae bacterium]|nr:nuclear transport factor 2 family protein [Gemmatimonadaceae bacterium]
MTRSLGRWRGAARSAVCAVIAVLGAAGIAWGQSSPVAASSSADSVARRAVDALNAKEVRACQQMDNPASAELWAEDGVDLIQGLEPMVGKAAIAAWLNGLTPGLKGAKMVYCAIDWKQITIQGDWAYEWGINKQRIEFPPPQQPFESEGKMTLVLKRQTSGEWKIELESWNSSPKAG